MSHDKEVSGVKVESGSRSSSSWSFSRIDAAAWVLSHRPNFTELRRINLYYLRRRFQALIQRSDDEEGTFVWHRLHHQDETGLGNEDNRAG
jgi:hypothetical protein